MSYFVTDNVAGTQQIADTSTTQNQPLGTIVRAKDPTYGEGEFIYLKGLNATVAGTWVTFNYDDNSTTLLAANAIGPVAVAMSACVTSSYGWYQISGKAFGISADVADNASLYIDTAVGTVDDAVVAGDRVWNAKAASADDTATGLVEAEISRPFVTDAT